MAGDKPRVIQLRERDPMLFPYSDLFDKTGYSLVLPETRALKAVEMRDILDGVELRANGLIGYLPLTADIVLNLVPKFPIQHLWHMLTVADTEYDKVLPVLRSYQTDNTTPPHQLLARSFSYFLRKILALGLARGYQQQPHRGHFKPKVNFGRTVSAYLGRGDELNVASDSFVFSAELRPNAFLKAACLDFLRLMPRDPKWEADRKLLAEALNALDTVVGIEMSHGDQSSAAALPVWLRDAYQGALDVYAIQLGYSRIGFSYEAQGTVMPSFLFSMDKIFESYVRNTLRSAFASEKIAVLDGNLSQNHGYLFADSKRFPVQPDLIFRRKKAILGMGEVKYKPSLNEHDRYQVISHAVAIGAAQAIWISPAPSTSKPGLEYVGSIAPGTKFYHYLFDISAGDLKKSSSAMIRDIRSLIAR